MNKLITIYRFFVNLFIEDPQAIPPLPRKHLLELIRTAEKEIDRAQIKNQNLEAIIRELKENEIHNLKEALQDSTDIIRELRETQTKQTILQRNTNGLFPQDFDIQNLRPTQRVKLKNTIHQLINAIKGNNTTYQKLTKFLMALQPSRHNLEQEFFKP